MQDQKFSNEFLPKCLKIFGENLNLLFESEVIIQNLEIQKIQPDQFGDSISIPTVVSHIQAEHDYRGNGYLIFSKQDAILLGCLLAETGETAMHEKMASMRFTDDDFDSFKEICNQIVGLLDQVFVDLLPHKIHLKQVDHLKLEDEKDLEQIVDIIKDEHYLMSFPFQFDFDKKYQANLNFVIPDSLISQFSKGEFKSHTEDVSNQINSQKALEVLFVQLDKTKDSSLKNIFDNNNISCRAVKNLSQLKNLAQQNSKKLVVIEANHQISKGIEVCRRISYIFGNSPIPIWLQGTDWNSFSVYNATLAGANYVLVSPINKSVVNQRLGQLCSQGTLAS